MAERTAMPTSEELEGRWDEIKGRIREKWGQLTDNELDQWKGRGDQLVGFIERKTGVARDQIEDFLSNVYSQGAGLLETVRQKAGEYTAQAGERLQEGYQYASDSVAHGFHGAEDMIRRRPGESIAVAFGAGVLVGMVLTLTMRGR